LKESRFAVTTSALKRQETSNRKLLNSGSFTSYSLNFEDVILHRLFPGTENGIYVDVGAGHPRLENDTFALYQRGWHGINIEPNHGFHAALTEERPRDTNIRGVLSDSFGDVCTYYELEGSGLSTCDVEQAAAYQAIGLDLDLREVSTTTLSSILTEAGITHFNILKVDVEGFEEKVLVGNDWERFRPDVVLVEVTYPENPVRRPTNILSFMEQRGYRHVHFDGLNDFYLECEFEAPEGLNLPPNVFDRFVPHQIGELKAEVDALRKHSNTAEEYALSLEAELKSRQRQSVTAENYALTLQAEIKSLGLKLTAVEKQAEEALHAADALAFENRRIGHQSASLSRENCRLRGSSEQMRSELLVLNQLLEPLHALAEHGERQREHRDGELAELKRQLAAAKARLESVYSSRCWLLTVPLRWIDKVLHRVITKK
jgi:FkbM family methyltransferase